MAWSLLAGSNPPDAAFAPRFEVSGSIAAAVVQPDNKAVVAGSFTTMNGVGRKGLARLNADGTLDATFQLTTDAYVIDMAPVCLALQADGKILVGGRIHLFLQDGSQRSSLIRLNANGSLDTTFDAGNWGNGGLDNPVMAVATNTAGRILIGGAFTYGGKYNYVARLNSDGTADTTFKSGTGTDGNVLAVALQSDGKILLGGQFTTFNGVMQAGFCRLNVDGSLDTTFKVGTGARGAVRSIAVLPNGKVVLGGSFSSVQDFGANLVARLGADGQVDKTFSGGSYFYDVTQVLAEADGGVVVGGWQPVMIFGGYPTDHDAYLISYAPDGTARYARYFDGKPTDVLALARRPDGRVVCGGTFRSDSGATSVRYAHGICLLETTLAFAPFSAVAGQTATVTGMLEQPDGKFIAVGSFNLVNGENQFYVARLNPNGTTDTAYRPGFKASDEYYTFAAALLNDGRLLFANRRITTNGVLDASYTNVPYGTATAMAKQPDGKVLVASSPTAMNLGLARLLADGSPDPSFDVKGGLSSFLQPAGNWARIQCIVVLPGGSILIGGSFDKFNDQPRVGIARLNADGSVDSSFIPAALRSSSQWSPVSVNALLPLLDGKLLAGGNFMQVEGINRSSIVRLNADGSFDTSFITPLDNTGGTVYALAQRSDDSLLVGGAFQLRGDDGIYYNAFVRLQPEGQRDATFAPGFESMGTEVRSFLTTKSGQLIITGTFSSADGMPRSSVVKYTPSPLPPRLKIRRLTDPQVQLTWPNYASNYVLESNLKANASNQWIRVTNAPVESAGSFTLTNQAIDPARFFRLRQ